MITLDNSLALAIDEISLEGESGCSLAKLWKLMGPQMFERQFTSVEKRWFFDEIVTASGCKIEMNGATRNSLIENGEQIKIFGSKDSIKAALGVESDASQVPSDARRKVLEAVGDGRRRGLMQAEVAMACNLTSRDVYSHLEGLTAWNLISRIKDWSRKLGPEKKLYSGNLYFLKRFVPTNFQALSNVPGHSRELMAIHILSEAPGHEMKAGDLFTEIRSRSLQEKNFLTEFLVKLAEHPSISVFDKDVEISASAIKLTVGSIKDFGVRLLSMPVQYTECSNAVVDAYPYRAHSSVSLERSLHEQVVDTVLATGFDGMLLMDLEGRLEMEEKPVKQIVADLEASDELASILVEDSDKRKVKQLYGTRYKPDGLGGRKIRRNETLTTHTRRNVILKLVRDHNGIGKEDLRSMVLANLDASTYEMELFNADLRKLVEKAEVFEGVMGGKKRIFSEQPRNVPARLEDAGVSLVGEPAEFSQDLKDIQTVSKALSVKNRARVMHTHFWLNHFAAEEKRKRLKNDFPVRADMSFDPTSPKGLFLYLPADVALFVIKYPVTAETLSSCTEITDKTVRELSDEQRAVMFPRKANKDVTALASTLTNLGLVSRHVKAGDEELMWCRSGKVQLSDTQFEFDLQTEADVYELWRLVAADSEADYRLGPKVHEMVLKHVQDVDPQVVIGFTKKSYDGWLNSAGLEHEVQKWKLLLACRLYQLFPGGRLPTVHLSGRGAKGGVKRKRPGSEKMNRKPRSAKKDDLGEPTADQLLLQMDAKIQTPGDLGDTLGSLVAGAQDVPSSEWRLWAKSVGTRVSSEILRGAASVAGSRAGAGHLGKKAGDYLEQYHLLASNNGNMSRPLTVGNFQISSLLDQVQARPSVSHLSNDFLKAVQDSRNSVDISGNKEDDLETGEVFGVVSAAIAGAVSLRPDPVSVSSDLIRQEGQNRSTLSFMVNKTPLGRRDVVSPGLREDIFSKKLVMAILSRPGISEAALYEANLVSDLAKTRGMLNQLVENDYISAQRIVSVRDDVQKGGSSSRTILDKHAFLASSNVKPRRNVVFFPRENVELKIGVP